MDSYMYGQIEDDLEKAKAIVEEGLGIVLQGRNSLFWGGDYYVHRDESWEVEVKIRSNWDLDDEMPAEEEFAEYKILVEIATSDDTWPTEDQLTKLRSLFPLLRVER